MKISSKGIYALQAMIELAGYNDSELVSIREIAEKNKISIKYLEQIFKQLKNAGLLMSTRGKGGGYRLAKSSDKIQAFDVVFAVEASLALVPCLQEKCARKENCLAHCVWYQVQQEILMPLKSYTIAQLYAQYNEVRS